MRLTSLASLPSAFGAVTGTIVSPSADLLEAIAAFFTASSLPSIITGGIFLERAGRQANLPYAVLDELGQSLSLSTSETKLRKAHIRFRVYADSLATASTIGDAIEDAFRGQRLSYTGGYTGPFVVGNRKRWIDVQATKLSRDNWAMSVAFSFQVMR